MASSVKLFQLFEKIHQIIGIHPNQNQHSPVLRKTIILIGHAQLILATALFSRYETNSMYDYGFGFFILDVLISSIAIYSLLIWQRENTVKFVEGCEEFVAQSKR